MYPLEWIMKPPDPEFRERNRKERLWFVKKQAEWVRSVPNEVRSEEQCRMINALYANKDQFPLTKEEYLNMIEKARAFSKNRKGSPPFPERLKDRNNQKIEI